MASDDGWKILGLIGLVGVIGLITVAIIALSKNSGGTVTILDGSGAVLYTVSDKPVRFLRPAPFEPAGPGN